MPFLELFPKSDRSDQSTSDQANRRTPTPLSPGRDSDPSSPVATAIDPSEISNTAAGRPSQPGAPASRPIAATRIKVRTGRFGELEEHELIHLLDTLDDERARARFRESIYISVIVYLAVAWFLFYGPRVLFHVPQYRDPIAVMKEHDQQLTLNLPKAPAIPRTAPKIDPKTMAALKRAAEMERLAHPTPPTPQPPEQQQAPPPSQEEAHNTAPPVPQPPMPLPAAPKPAPPSVDLPAAPKPNFAQNSQSPHDALQSAVNGALSGRNSSGGIPSAPGGSAGKLGAGAEILSDTQGVDFSAYMRRLQADLYRNWEPLIPEEVQAPLLKRGITGIIFIILPDGQIGGMKLETPSGDEALDRAAWGAITSEGKFPPLPVQFHGPNLELRVGFFYNTPIQR
jgi:outer membrane biosynthesis protein TonB